MAYKQLVNPNLNTKGSVGWCLKYADNAFGLAGGEATAWLGWEHAKYKHSGNPPAGVWTIQWYSYYENGANYGHVTFGNGKQIYSSPWKYGTTHAVLSNIAEVERTYGVKYVGWSEDISGRRVVEPVAAPAPKPSPKPAPKPSPAPVYHVVVSGEFLGKIAANYHTTIPQLVAWNKAAYPTLASNPNFIRIGWKLRVR